MHGYDHRYISKKRGLNPMWARSEFAGVPLEIQKEKIRFGLSIFNSHGISPKYFFAPSHTFDENTLIALRDESEIRVISDTIATKPYKHSDFIFIPQVVGSCRKMIIPGVWTFCLHPSMMDSSDFDQLSIFLSEYNSQFISFDDINIKKIKTKNLISKTLSFIYFTLRSIKGLK